MRRYDSGSRFLSKFSWLGAPTLCQDMQVYRPRGQLTFCIELDYFIFVFQERDAWAKERNTLLERRESFEQGGSPGAQGNLAEAANENTNAGHISLQLLPSESKMAPTATGERQSQLAAGKIQNSAANSTSSGKTHSAVDGRRSSSNLVLEEIEEYHVISHPSPHVHEMLGDGRQSSLGELPSMPQPLSGAGGRESVSQYLAENIKLPKGSEVQALTLSTLVLLPYLDELDKIVLRVSSSQTNGLSIYEQFQ